MDEKRKLRRGEDSHQDLLENGSLRAGLGHFPEPYLVEIYYGENRYVSCTVTLDDEENPVYSRPDAELAKLPDVRMMRKDAGVAEIKSHGFTEVYTKTGLSHGLSGLKNVGKVEKIEPAPGDYYPVDTPVTLTIYR